MKKVFIAIIICILSSSVANAGDYKYVRTYDANGNIIKKEQIIQINDFINHAFEYECLTYLEYLNKKIITI